MTTFLSLSPAALSLSFLFGYISKRTLTFSKLHVALSLLLRRFITQEYHKMEVQPRVPQTLTTAVSWRPEGIEYKKNEVFLDDIESVNMLVSVLFQSMK